MAPASFGRCTTALPVAAPPTPRPRFAYLGPAVFALCAALITMYVWFEIIKVPLERPFGPLFDNPRTALREGWAPWYVAPPVSFALTFALFWPYFRKAHRWTVLGLALAAVIAIMLGSTVAYWVKNIGYTWYFVPNATVLAILSVQGPMFGTAFGRGAQALIQHAPLSFPTAALFGVVIGLLLDLPFRHTAVVPATPAASERPAPAHQVGMFGRLVTAAIMTLFVTAVAAAGMPGGAVLVAPLVALTWWYLSFRGGRYDVLNILLGSALQGVISTLPLVLGLASAPGIMGNHGFDPEVLALGFVTRTPVYFLVSFVLIRITLALSRVAGKVRRLAPS